MAEERPDLDEKFWQDGDGETVLRHLLGVDEDHSEDEVPEDEEL